MSIMDFCPECGTRLISKREKEGTKGALQMVCPKCGYKKSGKNRPAVPPKRMKKRSHKESITVIGKEHQIRTLPTAKKTCPKCGNTTLQVGQEEDLIDVFTESAEKSDVEVEVISGSHEEGEMLLKSFGGVAALLRFKQ